MDGGDEQTSVSGCRVCGSRLAHDQRYCLHCGTRRNSLPAYIAQAIGRIREQGGAVGERPSLAAAPAAHDAGDADVAASDAGPLDALRRAPRAAAVAVLGVLGFGALLGSLVGESAATAPQQIILAVTPHNSPQTSALGAAAGGGIGGAGGGSSAGGGGGTRTITVGTGGTETITTPAPGSSSAAPGSTSSTSTTTTTATTGGTLPPIKHVFMITLSDEGYNQTFGHTADDPYLAKTLAAKGEVVPNYYAVAGGPLANEIALVSGQGPTPDTVEDCPTFTNVVPGSRGAKGQVLGNGCVYPKHTQSLAGELTAAKLTWKAYVQVTGTGRKGQADACNHPRLGAADPQPSRQDPNAPWHNPFLYFHSLINKSPCRTDDVPLTQLATDLKTAKTTPALSYVIPDACDDGNTSPCTPTAPSGMTQADKFLKSVVPEIERSPAYKADGLIAITFDNAPQTGPNADPSSCCDNPTTYPNLPPPASGPTTTTTTGTTPTTTATTTTPTTSTSPTITSTTPLTTGTTTTTPTTTTPTSPTTTTPTTTTPPSLGSGQTNPTGGGGQVGLLLISRYVTPGMLDVTDYFNHFSLLASIESLFGLKRLGYASDPVLPVFGSAVYTNYTGG